MKAKYKYLNNINFLGDPVDYLTIGKVYEFEMEGDDFGVAYDKNSHEVFEFFPEPVHGQWEKFKK